MPKVTVLMPVYNGERYLWEAIESILRQTWTDFEFLIINDGSMDKSREIILSFNDPRICLVDNPTNIGLTKSLNRGLQLSKGELIARQDADDISYPTRLSREVGFLDTHPEVVLLGTSARAVDERGERKNIDLNMPTGLLSIRWCLMFQNAFIHSSVMFRRRIILGELGGYDESFARAQDYDLWSRAARAFEVENLSDVLIDHRFAYGSIVSLLPLPIPAEEDIAYKNLQVFLQDPGVPAEWAQFITHFRRKDEFSRRTNWNHIAKMYEKICARYLELYPESKLDKAIRSHMADVLYWIAYYSAPCNRRVSFRAYARARKLARRSRRRPSLIKYLILWMTGETVRRAYHRFRRCLRRAEDRCNSYPRKDLSDVKLR